MANNTFCAGLFSTSCATWNRVRGRMLPISLVEAAVVSVHMLYPSMLKLSVAFIHGDSVPIFNGSPPL